MGSVFVWLLCFVATASIALSKTPQLQLQVQTQCLCKKRKKNLHVHCLAVQGLYWGFGAVYKLAHKMRDEVKV